MPKVKYGLKNVHYAKILSLSNKNAATYAAPVAIPGAVSMTMDPQGDVQNFRADNTNYWVGRANNGYSGSIEIALIPDQFKIDILGYMITAGGMLVENAEATPAPFALLFQFENDEGATRRIFYNVNASRPSVNGQTTEASITPQTETLNLETATVYNETADTAVSYAEAGKDSSEYDTFFDAVVLPSAFSAGAQLTALSIGSLTLDPTFAANKTKYTAGTTSASDAVTATADAGVAVNIAVNGEPIDSGDSASWNMGANTVTITATKAGIPSTTYTVIVTRTAAG